MTTRYVKLLAPYHDIGGQPRPDIANTGDILEPTHTSPGGSFFEAVVNNQLLEFCKEFGDDWELMPDGWKPRHPEEFLPNSIALYVIVFRGRPSLRLDKDEALEEARATNRLHPTAKPAEVYELTGKRLEVPRA